MNLLRSLLSAVLVAGLAANTRADILIDDFNAPNPRTQYLITLNNPSPSVFTTLGASPGVNRTVTLNVTSPQPYDLNALSGSIGTNGGNTLFSMSLNDASSGTAAISYTFTAAKNFIPNVASGGSLGALTVVSRGDSGLDPTTPLAIVIHTATGDLAFTTTLSPGAAFASNNIGFGSFVAVGENNPDLTQVTGLDLTITAGIAADVSLDSIGVTTPPPPTNEVPAPPAALLALLAVPALAARHRRTKKDVQLA